LGIKITLADQIRDLGEKVLEFESGFELEKRVEELTREPVIVVDLFKDILNHYIAYRDLATQNGVKLGMPIPDEIIDSKDYPHHLGLNLLSHDLANIAFPLYDAGPTLLSYEEDGETQSIKDTLNEPTFFLRYEITRINLPLITYIATGDPKFALPVEVSNSRILLRHMLDERYLSCEFDGIANITSDELLSIYQLAKNAVRFIPDGDSSIEVRLQEDSQYHILTVRDYGTGIPEDKLPFIFQTFTENGTGIGLQVVKRIADLRNGHIEVTSTQKGRETFKYDTKSNELLKVAEGQPQGTTFTLYLGG